MRGGIAAIAPDHDFPAGVQPAHIGRCRAFHIDLGIFQAHAADALTRIFYIKAQGLSFRMPQRAADIMLTGRFDPKFSFPFRYGGADRLQQVLGRHPIVILQSLDRKHASVPS